MKTLIILAFASLLGGTTVFGDVIYTFDSNTVPFNPGAGIPLEFEYDSPAFITSDTTVATSLLTSESDCSMFVPCVEFIPDVAMGASAFDEVKFQTATTGTITYDFNLGALSADGTYDIFLQGATLAVAGQPNAAVPEPSSLQLVLVLLIGLGAMRTKFLESPGAQKLNHTVCDSKRHDAEGPYSRHQI